MINMINQKTKLSIIVFFLLFSFISIFNFKPIQAQTIDDMNPIVSETEQFPETIQEDADDEPEYNEDGFLEKAVISLYGTKIKIMGNEIDFGNLANSINNMISFENMKNLNIENGDASFNMYSFFKDTIFPLVQGLASTILILMMMWKYIKESLEVERFTWEKAMMIFIKFFICQMFIANIFGILTMFATEAMNLMNQISTSSPNIQSVGVMFASVITDGGWIEKGCAFVVAIIFSLLYYGSAIAVVVQVLVRIVKILVAMAFSPIPIALTMDESHGSDVFKYCFWAFGLFLQAPIIKVSTYIYSLVLTEMTTGIGGEGFGIIIPLCIGVVIANGLLAALISMAQQVTDRLLPA